ncbi:hypothetical protein VE01_07858 [Pseudogymnoascus verrucosus]|uniref:t-SNARE coiled-coil homology domain-containing protein n=1 Tax=Pseudogymnoascus verrucosus TaxID=342668 RepID=A0A1B8GEF1_9PEZI|nr:uncharacterized protein VE01_07858 [Pseudogymnoascus verrucosus]OBT94210.2 hypothetical protein VE01_07858 [Pseudogymnoascus verrucosus]
MLAADWPDEHRAANAGCESYYAWAISNNEARLLCETQTPSPSFGHFTNLRESRFVFQQGELFYCKGIKRDQSLGSFPDVATSNTPRRAVYISLYCIPAMSNPNQLFLLADHIKLSLLERQRAISLNLEPNSQDGHISRSLESFRAGLENIAVERESLEDAGDTAALTTLKQSEQSLQAQYDDLTSQFHGFPSTNPSSLSQPNDPSLAADFAHASSHPQRSSSLLKKSLRGHPGAAASSPKSVRFSDAPSAAAAEDPARAQLFPYRDDPIDAPTDQSQLDNQQIHAYHSEVLAAQDEQLDRLGESIGRQRELSIQIGDELDSQVAMLDEVDGLVDRHQTRLDQARKSLGNVARKAKGNMQVTTIIVLIIILVLLIIILK